MSGPRVTRWSVPQVLAWIILRDDTLVDKFSDHGRRQPLTMCEALFRLAAIQPAQLAPVGNDPRELAPWHGLDLRISADDAMKEMMDAMSAGLQCIGQPLGGGPTQVIPRESWPGMRIIDHAPLVGHTTVCAVDGGYPDTPSVLRGHHPGAPSIPTAWTKLTVASVDARKAWPKPSTPRPSTVRYSGAAASYLSSLPRDVVYKRSDIEQRLRSMGVSRDGARELIDLELSKGLKIRARGETDKKVGKS